MQTKLTLTIKQSVIENAKRYARAKNKSVSKLVEDYLSNISSQTRETSLELGQSPITKRLTGALAQYDTKEEYTTILETALLEKNR
jgi:Family of unknown function (DUF6364)